ncbi:hypothetical protein [Mycobacterium shimoidei]|uniref:Transmembrane protein n=1 Tax=Mycobacterium shimoidei TaxID=29313 RepID=A0A1E3TBI6_MYCSH|nr:hypothetical protein [Mycobacterium shimoidei]MCV7260441.1 hypothetical protein [Mycobacterium shimoidei]ODR11283.1 hypothetical protein BHQ16_18445 [Mycobacterium shimoidei]ORW78167.1 hypothetical protein AWC26_18305 [Mycobacterium shimoidei]SRX92255.1 hypothetical protein MSP7336_00480 [Mycobacterium shimoidei]
MTGPNDSPGSRPISVAELLAKNGTLGAPPPAGRRRRRRGNTEAVTVAELTGEIPVVSEDAEHDQTRRPGPGSHARRANGAARADDKVETPYWSEAEPRWPESSPPRPHESAQPRSPYPLPLRRSVRVDEERPGAAAAQSGAEGMNPDPLEDYAGIPVDVMDTDVREAEPPVEDSAYVRSYLGSTSAQLPGDTLVSDDLDEDYLELDEATETEATAATAKSDATAETDVADVDDVEDAYAWSDRTETIVHGGLIVLQSILAVAFGAGLFIAFDQLWRWNNIVALVLSVLVILGLVVGVRVVRRTEDIGSTLIAVAVGALVTLGPLALLQSG